MSGLDCQRDDEGDEKGDEKGGVRRDQQRSQQPANDVNSLARYHDQRVVPLAAGELYTKPGVRGYPGPPPAADLFRHSPDGLSAPIVDAAGAAGAFALTVSGTVAGTIAASAAGTVGGGGSEGSSIVVAEPSMAALRCARRTLGGRAVVQGALPWDLSRESVATLALAPPADRGNARVEAELRAAARALLPDGRLLLALHKDQGGKRYQKLASELFSRTEVVARERGWRLIEAAEPLDPPPASDRADPADAGEPWLSFEAGGFELESLAGVYSAGKLDPGTAVLSAVLPWRDLAGQRVLDLGCGYGLLALSAARAGAAVTALDDDLAAVKSTDRNARRLGLQLSVLHSDIDSELTGQEHEGSFDIVITNPPFHVGRGVRLEVPEAFIAAARRLLRPGGELWLVANRDLPYERSLRMWASFSEEADERGFKVLRAKR